MAAWPRWDQPLVVSSTGDSQIRGAVKGGTWAGYHLGWRQTRDEARGAGGLSGQDGGLAGHGGQLDEEGHERLIPLLGVDELREQGELDVPGFPEEGGDLIAAKVDVQVGSRDVGLGVVGKDLGRAGWQWCRLAADAEVETVVAGAQVVEKALPVITGGVQDVDVADGAVFFERGGMLGKGHVGLLAWLPGALLAGSWSLHRPQAMTSLPSLAISIMRRHGRRNIAAALRNNARDATRVLPLLGSQAHESDIPALCRGPG